MNKVQDEKRKYKIKKHNIKLKDKADIEKKQINK